MKKKPFQNLIILISLVCCSLSSWARNTQGELLVDGATAVTSQMHAMDYNYLERVKTRSGSLLQQVEFKMANLSNNALTLPYLAEKKQNLLALLKSLQDSERQGSGLSADNYIKMTSMLDIIESDILKVEGYRMIEQQNRGER